MKIKVRSNGKSEDYCAEVALELFKDMKENEDAELLYSPAVKLIGKYWVDYRFGDDPYIVYEFECFEDIQVNRTEVEDE